MAKNYQEEYIGKEMIVLVEQKKNNYWIGHTSNYLHVKIEGKYNHNEFVNVKIKNINAFLFITNLFQFLFPDTVLIIFPSSSK